MVLVHTLRTRWYTVRSAAGGAIDEAAKDLLDLVIRVASGEQTKAEKHGFREISIFKDGVVL